jgi:hypothetical protein
MHNTSREPPGFSFPNRPGLVLKTGLLFSRFSCRVSLSISGQFSAVKIVCGLRLFPSKWSGPYLPEGQASTHLQRLRFHRQQRDDDDVYQLTIKKLLALAFLPAQHVKDSFNEILTHAPLAARTTLLYFREYYVDGRRPRGPARRTIPFSLKCGACGIELLLNSTALTTPSRATTLVSV